MPFCLHCAIITQCQMSSNILITSTLFLFIFQCFCSSQEFEIQILIDEPEQTAPPTYFGQFSEIVKYRPRTEAENAAVRSKSATNWTRVFAEKDFNVLDFFTFFFIPN